MYSNTIFDTCGKNYLKYWYTQFTIKYFIDSYKGCPKLLLR